MAVLGIFQSRHRPTSPEPEQENERIPPEGRAVVEATLRAARNTVAFALASVALILALVAAERTWFLRTEAAALERVKQAEDIADQILLADEQLTMSAYMAAATGEERWIARYYRYLPDMEAALARAQALAPTDVARRFHEQSKAASDSLVSLETTALDVVRAPEVARAILDSERYRDDKAALSSATHEFTATTLAVMRSELAQLRGR